VPADVDESSELIVGVANEDDGHGPVLPCDEVTGLGELFAAREILPGSGEKLLLLDRCYCWIAVPGPGNGLRGNVRSEFSGSHDFPFRFLPRLLPEQSVRKVASLSSGFGERTDGVAGAHSD